MTLIEKLNFDANSCVSLVDKNGEILKEGSLVRKTGSYADYANPVLYQIVTGLNEGGERVLTVDGEELMMFHGANGYCSLEIVSKT